MHHFILPSLIDDTFVQYITFIRQIIMKNSGINAKCSHPNVCKPKKEYSQKCKIIINLLYVYIGIKNAAEIIEQKITKLTILTLKHVINMYNME